MPSRRFTTFFAAALSLTLVASLSPGDRPGQPADESAAAYVDTLLATYAHLLPEHRGSDAGIERWVDSTMARLSMDEKIGQLLVVDLDRRELRHVGSARRAVLDFHVGGFLVPRNMEPDEVWRQTQALQRTSTIPLLFAADYERGAGGYDNALTELPSSMAVGATADTAFAYLSGLLTGIEARQIGVNWLFAPVVDVNNNADNPIINIRSYGEQPELVSRMAAAYVAGARRAGVLPTLKHFPGHGDTSVDSHVDLPVVDRPWDSLLEMELSPYRRLAGLSGPLSVMSAHIWLPAIDEGPLPATMSPTAMTAVLRDSLAFSGPVVTDHIRMGALSDTFSYEERVVRPLAAGIDVILGANDTERARRAIEDALSDGALTAERIDEAVRRILWAKAQLGLQHERLVPSRQMEWMLERPRGERWARAIAARSVTRLHNDGIVPLARTDSLVLVQLTNQPRSQSIGDAMDLLAARLRPSADFRVTGAMESDERSRILEAVSGAPAAVVTLYQRLLIGRGGELDPSEVGFVRALIATGTPVVIVTFGNPYAVASFRRPAAVFVTYDQAPATVDALADVLLGSARATGRLPVTVGRYAVGTGS